MSITLYHRDCLEVIKELDDGSVDAVVTDPPYGVGYDTWDERIPFELLPEFLRIATGPVLWFGAAPQVSVQAGSFDPAPQRILIWSPKFTLSHTRANGLYYRWHPIYCWRLPDKVESFKWDILSDNTECGKNWWKHGATKPVALMKKLVGVAPDSSTVLDPFMGSGTTGVACVQTGRNFVGIEIDEGYYQIAQQRIAEAQLQMRLPMEVGV